MAVSVFIAFLIRAVLILLFFPFSALDKILNFRGAVAQAREVVPQTALAACLVLGGLAIEVTMSLAVLTGVADRAAALVLALYCAATALLWKRFWAPGDFWASSQSEGRLLFWDFLKNFALAAGFLLLTFGSSARTVERFFAAPLASSHPYDLHREVGP